MGSRGKKGPPSSLNIPSEVLGGENGSISISGLKTVVNPWKLVESPSPVTGVFPNPAIITYCTTPLMLQKS